MARSSDPWLAFPMFLLVTGSELHKDSCRTDLWSMFNAAAAAAGTVRRGIQHFWITWFVPTTPSNRFLQAHNSRRCRANCARCPQQE